MRHANFDEGGLDRGAEGGPLGQAGIVVNNPLLGAKELEL
jgi:hypothetical protein